jgi:uncharacterized protein (DUF1697 family)
LTLALPGAIVQIENGNYPVSAAIDRIAGGTLPINARVSAWPAGEMIMTKYAALLRGIEPLNPNMRNEKLRGVFESLGFQHVQTVISSGNVLFETGSKNVKALEAAIEKALPLKLGFTSTTIIRSREQLQELADKNPFQGLEDTPKSRLNVTFLKNPPHTKLKFPYRAGDKTYEVLGMYGGAICSVVDLTGAKTPDLMSWLEKQFGKDITTRTWKTVGRILKKLNES